MPLIHSCGAIFSCGPWFIASAPHLYSIRTVLRPHCFKPYTRVVYTAVLWYKNDTLRQSMALRLLITKCGYTATFKFLPLTNVKIWLIQPQINTDLVQYVIDGKALLQSLYSVANLILINYQYYFVVLSRYYGSVVAVSRKVMHIKVDGSHPS
jgi:hypothetical protein